MAPQYETADCATGTIYNSNFSNPLGPSMSDYWPCCWEHQPYFFTLVWITAPLLFAIVVSMSIWHAVSLRAAPVTGFRQIYFRCSLFPIWTSFWTLVVVMTSPRSAALADTLKAQYEGYVLFGFASLIFQMLVLEVAAARRESDFDGDDDVEVGERIVQAMQLQGQRKFFAVAPLCCCLGFLCKKHHISGRQLLLCMFLLQQYMLVIPSSTLISLWTALVDPLRFKHVYNNCQIVSKFSQLSALWGLFVLYFATKKVRNLSTQWRTTQKFVSLKMIVLIQILQRPLVGLSVRHLIPLILPGKAFCLTADAMIDIVNCWIMLSWCVVLNVLIMRAFKSKEIMNEDGTLYIPGDFALDLKRHVQSVRRSEVESRGSQHERSRLSQCLPQASGMQQSGVPNDFLSSESGHSAQSSLLSVLQVSDGANTG